jgi:ABC-type antimicrobial peptide transport system permease subunit
MIFYTPYPQFAWPGMTITVRTAGDLRDLSSAVRSQVFAADRDLPIVNFRTLQQVVDQNLSQPRQMMYLIAGFAAVALLLAVVGLYGVMAYSVAQRTTEFGIRQAIGAQRRDILRMVLAQGLRLSLAGIAAGILAAVALTRLIATVLYRVRATDPLTFSAVALLFLLVALAATFIPAWRATRVDPFEALRGN